MARVRVFNHSKMLERRYAANTNMSSSLIESSGGLFLWFVLIISVATVIGKFRRKRAHTTSQNESVESGGNRNNSPGCKRKPRTYSKGDYGNPPSPDKIPSVAVSQGHILNPVATRTMSTIIRIHWPVGSFTYREAMLNTQGKFEESVLKEFRRYYKNEDGTCESQWNKEVITHVETRMRGLKCEAKREAFRRAATYKTSIVEQRPEYFSNEVWVSMCGHFLGEEHASKSEINKSNRLKKTMVHATGPTSHAKIVKDLTEKIGQTPTRLEFFEAAYKYKDTQTFTSDKAREIAERYKQILDERLQTLEEQGKEPLEWWIEAVGPVKKNRILGIPRVSANELLAGSYNEKHESKLPTQSNCGGCVAKDLFFEVVNETLQSANSNALFKEVSVSSEEVRTLAEDVALNGGISNLESSTVPENNEVIRLVIKTLESIYSKIHRSLKERQNDGQGTAATPSEDLDFQ